MTTGSDGTNSQSVRGPALEKRLSTDALDHVNSRAHVGGCHETPVGHATQKGSVECGSCFDFLHKFQSDHAVADDGECDVLLVGGGIMCATLGVMLQELEPTWKIRMYERLSQCGEEASNGWNNAGTGHAALCELNYTPESKDGVIDIKKAIEINEKFQVSRQWWSWLAEEGRLGDTSEFISKTPHMTFVHGEKNVDFLKRRFELLKPNVLFEDMEFSTDHGKIGQWAPLLLEGRDPHEAMACTRYDKGTDVDYGALTKHLVRSYTKNGGVIRMNHEIQSMEQQPDGSWKVIVYKRDLSKSRLSCVRAKFVFVGAGGATLQILQKSGIPEIKGFGGFPISGEFLVCQNKDVVKKHGSKIYGKAAVGAPPMSVPHLDARIIDGKEMILFGPYAGFSPKFLKEGSYSDLFTALRPHNLLPMATAGLKNFDLAIYLLKELAASKEKKLAALQEFLPDAKPEDWSLVTAGQRVQIMKRNAGSTWNGILQFGTEVVSAKDGTIAGLLGASPGASVSVQVAVDVLSKCFPNKIDGWTPQFQKMIPSFGTQLNDNPLMAREVMAKTGKVLNVQ